MKHCFYPLIFLSLLLVCCSKESEISLEREKDDPNFISMSEARADIEKLIAMIPSTTKAAGGHREISDSWAISVSTKSVESEAEVYVFNFKDSLGYAIVSNDVRIGLVGLATEGNFDSSSEITNPGLIVTLSNAQSVLAYVDSLDVPHEPVITYEYGEWENVFSAPTYGYCLVKWDQDSPYNHYCFTSDGQRAKTGCVATAVAQLMSIYKYPTYYSYYSFNWNNMISSPSTTDSQGNYSVGILMQQLGIPSNLDMQYGVSSSGASPANIPRTLVNFGYSNGGSLNDYATYTVVSELESGYPVLVGGFDTRHTTVKKNIFGKVVNTSYSYEGGHRWLVHGLLNRRRLVSQYKDGLLVSSYYQNTYYILCNFGWNGDGDGYYANWAFDVGAGPVYPESIRTRKTTTTTESDPYNFRFNVKAITGIRR